MMNFVAWAQMVPDEITGDTLWKMKAYQLALFAGDIGWFDVTKLMRDKRTLEVADQLYRSVGSVSANLAEGYSRGSGKDRARFYEYSLGSAREARDWYYKARHILGPEVTSHRLRLLTDVIQLLLTMVPQQRGSTLRENGPVYYASETTTSDVPLP